MKCTDCPLHKEGGKTNCMPGKGYSGGIMFIGENPGREEDEKGEPFVGKAGRILRILVEDSGLEKKAFYTNSTRCRSITIKRKPKISEIRECRKHLLREIDEVKPRMIVCLGEHASKSITDDPLSRISHLRGTTSTFHGIPVLFTYHPSAVNYNMNILSYLEEDFEKIKNIFSGIEGKEDRKSKWAILPYERLSSDNVGSIAAVDIETNSISPYRPSSKIMSIAVAVSEDRVYYKYCNSPPGSEEMSFLLSSLQSFDTIITHNALFDMTWLTYCKGYEGIDSYYHPKSFLWKKKWEDTIIALQFKDEHYMNTGLKHLGQVYCNLKKWSTPSFIAEGFPAGWDTESNLESLKRYNCKDAIATWKLRKVLVEKNIYLQDKKITKAYDWMDNVLKLAVKIKHSGIYINKEELKNLQEYLLKEIKKASDSIKYLKIDISSKKSIMNHIFKRNNLPILMKTPKSREPSLSREHLSLLSDRDNTGFIENYLKIKDMKHILNTYCLNLKEEEGIHHPNIFVARNYEKNVSGGSNTGRITFSILSNLPKVKEDSKDVPNVRRCLTSRYGKKGIMLSVDYSQMEMRIMADLSGDENLIQALEDNLDLHTYVASRINNIKMDRVSPEQRFRAKAVNFGIIYGIGPRKLSYQTNMSLNDAKRFIDSYFRKFPRIKEYIDNQTRKALEEKLVLSPIGRPFHLENALDRFSKDSRKSVNSPIQSGASNFNDQAAIFLQKFIEDMDLRACVCLLVYDSITSDWMRTELKRSNILSKDVADSIFVHSPKEYFRKTFGWNIKVPIQYKLVLGESLAHEDTSI